MNKIFSILRNSSGCRMNSSLKKRFDIFIISLLALLAVPNHLSAQNELKGPGHNPPGPIEQRIIIDVSMPMERLNQQYTSSLSYSFTSSGGTVSFAAYYDPIDPNSQYSSDVEYLNDCLASVQADTLMTFTSASTSTGQMWWDFTLQILPNNTFSTNDQTKAASRRISLVFPLSTGNTLTITVDQAKGEDRLPVFADWPDEWTPITEPLISHRPDTIGQDTETLTNWIRKATYIGDNPYPPNDSIVDIVWYNGLGQPKQTVMVGASATTSKNIITPVEYDPIGQQIREYLPYVSTQATENYDALTSHKQMQYYNTIYGNSEVYPYAETIPEAATNRPIIQYTQGKVFRTDASLNETQNGIHKPRTDAKGRFLSNAYRISQASDNIPMLLYENGQILNRGHFPDGALLKTITTDPDGKTVATFTDEYEKTHLVRTYLGGHADTTETGGWSDLVYVYDKRGLLSAVITPEGENERNKTATQISVNSDWAKKRCYIYEYDGLGRMSSRRWPGKGKELFVTDPAGNVVAIQDSLLRPSGRWRLTRYDIANRPTETLLTQQSITEAQMRGYFSYETAQQYFAQNGNALFTSPVYELTDNISLTKTETGKTDVSFNISQSLAISFRPEDQTVSLTDVDIAKFSSELWERTAMTMSKDGVLIGIAEDGSSNPGTVAQADILYRYTAYFYDCYARPIQTVTLFPDGTVFTTSTKYNYTGLPVRQTARLKVPQGTTTSTDTLNVVLTETFTYDKRGRMLASNAAMQTFNSFVENGNLAYSDTLSSSASATYSYDELGHLTGKTLGGNLSQTLAYNIQDWMTTTQTKKGTANVFSQTLRYYNPVKPNTTALYSGNISEWESVQGTSTASTYGFTYDTQGRLTNSNRYDGTSTTVSQLYTERDISYDRNGNILTLKRISNSIPSPLHNFTYSYDGDKLTTLSGSQSGTSFTSAYLYDGNGNMTMDGNQAVRLSYDINNLVHSAKKTATGQNPSPSQDELTATYSYFADGTKYSIKDTAGNGRIYIGPFTLARKDYQSTNITLLESADALGSDARFAFAATPQNPSGTDTTYTVAYETLYLLKDHLGSIRAITDNQGNALERNDYYPYGLQTDLGRNYATLGDKYRVRMPASFASGNPNISNLSVSSPSFEMTPYRMMYNGKELQMVAQTRLIYYGARQYDPTIARWNGMDPMAENYYSISQYAYCSNNPILFIDYNGEDYYISIVGNSIIIEADYYTDVEDDKYLRQSLFEIKDFMSHLIVTLTDSETGESCDYNLEFQYNVYNISKEQFQELRNDVEKGIGNYNLYSYGITRTINDAETHWGRYMINGKTFASNTQRIKHEILHTLGVRHYENGLMTETYEEPINGGDIIKSWYFEDTLYPIMNNYNYYYYNERQNSGKGIERQLNKRYKTGIKYINR
ncbi:MAG: hypothetical protein J6W86_05675 [Bacteroidales bacterium]|nr:hypothetical protein [Bacteroidales bacterium]